MRFAALLFAPLAAAAIAPGAAPSVVASYCSVIVYGRATHPHLTEQGGRLRRALASLRCSHRRSRHSQNADPPTAVTTTRSRSRSRREPSSSPETSTHSHSVKELPIETARAFLDKLAGSYGW